MKDQEPRKEVVDIDSFAAYINSIVQSIKRNPSLRKVPFITIIPGSNIDSVGEAAEELTDNLRDLLKPTEVILIGDIPWKNVPESLQEIIKLQYPTSSLNERKTIGIWLEPHRLSLRLNTFDSLTGYEVDKDEDMYAPAGVVLIFESDKRDENFEEHYFDPKGSTPKKGDFVITIGPLLEQIRLDTLMKKGRESLTQEEEEWVENNYRKRASFVELRIAPSSLIQLQDIVGVIERFKGNAVLFTDKVSKTT